MIRITVLYPHEQGKRFDVRYYVDHHMPMVRAKLEPFGLKATSIQQGLVRNGNPPPFVLIANMDFDSLEDFQRGMAQHSAEINADVGNYTDLRPVFQVSELLS